MSKLSDLFKKLVEAGEVDKGDEIEKLMPEFEAELDELDVIVADGLDWDDADEILGDVVPDIMKLVRKHLKDKPGAEKEEVVFNMIWLLKHHYKWDIPWVPEFIEKKLVRKIIAIACRAVRKDQKDPETDTTAMEAA